MQYENITFEDVNAQIIIRSTINDDRLEPLFRISAACTRIVFVFLLPWGLFIIIIIFFFFALPAANICGYPVTRAHVKLDGFLRTRARARVRRTQTHTRSLCSRTPLPPPRLVLSPVTRPTSRHIVHVEDVPPSQQIRAAFFAQANRARGTCNDIVFFKKKRLFLFLVFSRSSSSSRRRDLFLS